MTVQEFPFSELVKLAEAEQLGMGFVVEFGPMTAFQAILALQIAWRHPDAGPDVRAAIAHIAGLLSSHFGHPLDAVIKDGWRVPVEEPRGTRELSRLPGEA